MDSSMHFVCIGERCVKELNNVKTYFNIGERCVKELNKVKTYFNIGERCLKELMLKLL